jgi:hypothetical protein
VKLGFLKRPVSHLTFFEIFVCFRMDLVKLVNNSFYCCTLDLSVPFASEIDESNGSAIFHCEFSVLLETSDLQREISKIVVCTEK